MKLSGPEMLLEDRKRGRGWGGGRQEPSSTKGSRSKPAGFQMGTVGEGFSWGGRAQPPSLGKPLRLGGDSCALALLRGVSFSRAHTPRPPETLACSPETPRDTRPGPFEGAPHRVFLDEGGGGGCWRTMGFCGCRAPGASC